MQARDLRRWLCQYVCHQDGEARTDNGEHSPCSRHDWRSRVRNGRALVDHVRGIRHGPGRSAGWCWSRIAILLLPHQLANFLCEVCAALDHDECRESRQRVGAVHLHPFFEHQGPLRSAWLVHFVSDKLHLQTLVKAIHERHGHCTVLWRLQRDECGEMCIVVRQHDGALEAFRGLPKERQVHPSEIARGHIVTKQVPHVLPRVHDDGTPDDVGQHVHMDLREAAVRVLHQLEFLLPFAFPFFFFTFNLEAETFHVSLHKHISPAVLEETCCITEH
mmetsp:Transcript_47391/g.79315  ORF Transcript_47391/g.79315 Transcript_47391/m.79315 type:complete len:276 (-) Transcript_47391:407-1234(-)